jgi:hypothetical protein
MPWGPPTGTSQQGPRKGGGGRGGGGIKHKAGVEQEQEEVSQVIFGSAELELAPSHQLSTTPPLEFSFLGPEPAFSHGGAAVLPVPPIFCLLCSSWAHTKTPL